MRVIKLIELERLLDKNELEIGRGENGPSNLKSAQQGDPTSMGMTRREMLKGTGLLVVSFGLASSSDLLGTPKAHAAAAAALADPDPDRVDSHLTIDTTGAVTFYTSKIELGNGISTGYAQVVAEELYVAFDRVRAVLGDTARVPNVGGTEDSTAMSTLRSTPATLAANSAARLRYAAASAREALLRLAAIHFNESIFRLGIEDGVIYVEGDPDNQRIPYGDLVKNEGFLQLKLDPKTTFKNSAEYTIVGRSIPRIDIPGMITAQFEYIHDVRVPGMLHARVIRPDGQPRDKKLKLIGADASSIAGLPGLVKLLTITSSNTNSPKGGGFVAVVCEREEQAVGAAEKLKVTWDVASALPDDIYAAMRADGNAAGTAVNPAVGNVDEAMPKAAKKLKASYNFPLQMHGMIGPSCVVADVRNENGKVASATIWAGTQNTYATRGLAGVALGIGTQTSDPEIAEKVKVVWREPSGAYGRLLTDDAAVDAALISQAVNRPVRLQWSRKDEHGWESYGVASSMDVTGGLNEKGDIVAWTFDCWGATPESANTGSSYDFPNARFLAHTYSPTYLYTSALRAPGAPMAAFASEQFIDELAALANVDPLAYRIRHLPDQRRVPVLQEAANRSGWEARPSPNPANASNRAGVVRGRGIAFGAWRSPGTMVAAVAEVEVNQSTGAVRVLRVVEAIDCGLVVNPDAVLQQAEGCIIQGVSRGLIEEVKFNRRGVTSLDWASYPTLLFTQIPKIEVYLMKRTDQPSTGIGEPPLVPVPAAIANAIFDATGARVRQAPMTPERVKAALAAR